MNSKTVPNVDIVCSAWKQLSVDPNLTELERTWLAVWDYPVSDTYTRVSNNSLRFMVNIIMQLYGQMTEWKMPINLEEAVERVEASQKQTTGFAFIGNLNISKTYQPNFL